MYFLILYRVCASLSLFLMTMISNEDYTVVKDTSGMETIVTIWKMFNKNNQ